MEEKLPVNPESDGTDELKNEVQNVAEGTSTPEESTQPETIEEPAEEKAEQPEPADEIAAEVLEPAVTGEPLEAKSEEPLTEQLTEEKTQEVVDEVMEVEKEEVASIIEVVTEEAEEEELETELAHNLTDDEIAGLSRLQLVERLEETVQNADVNAIKGAVALLKVAYLAKTKEEHHEMYKKAASEEEAENIEISDPVDDRYKAAFAVYRANKQKFNDELEVEKQKNLEAKKHILDELKVLISSEETLKKTYDDFKVLQEKWKAIGMVPKSEAQGLWQNYHFLIEKFFDKVKINKELKDLDLRKNLERKIELCEKAEELIMEPSMTKAFKHLQELHDEWKEVGPVSQDKREEVWDRFKMASAKINERRHEFYGKIQEEQQDNYKAKVLLSEQLEQVVQNEYNSIKQWQDSTAKLNSLLAEWKTIGPAAQKVNNEIWNKFKSQLDAYFGAKKEYFGKLKEQQVHNYNLKVELCLQAEAFRESSDWRNASRELIRLQDEWKKIGPVPRKHSDKVWKRFRAACDEFFHRKSEYFKTQQSSEQDNLIKKRDIISRLESFEFGENRQENFDKVKDIQREWMETGHVPLKEKDKLFESYKETLNKVYDKLKISASEQQFAGYKSRFENAKDQPDAVRIINRERSALQTKIDELKEEILLWENNIGFFAKSKQANVLKAEFEGKISKGKEEVAQLEAKMKFLRNAAREQEQNKQ